jgi:rhamnulokinase
MNICRVGAFDLGAESGRLILGELNKRNLTIKEIRRFPNIQTNISGHCYWDILKLFEEIKHSLKLYSAQFLGNIESIAFDTWGVDFALLDSHGNIMELPYSYRDIRTKGIMEEFFSFIPRKRVYRLTGIQLLPFNTLFQLFAMVRGNSPHLSAIHDLLFIPDFLNYLLSGIKKTEFTFATTSQLYNPKKNDWDSELFNALGIRKTIMQEIVRPGTVLGEVSPDICQETGLNRLKLIATASHDTASAVVAIPATGKDWAYISSGTWSLMGVESKEPVLNDNAYQFNFTNEGGVEGTFRFLKNIMGLWLIQQCKKAWESENYQYDYNELAKLAYATPPFKALINPDKIEFLNPPDMPEAIRIFCKETVQAIPSSPGEITRCVLESLALQYKLVLSQLRETYSKPINKIHIVGGGAQNKLLCQFTANATGLPVLAGPVEATAIGNIMVQAKALGYVKSLTEIRKIIRESFNPVCYNPQNEAQWNKAYGKFVKISRMNK